MTDPHFKMNDDTREYFKDSLALVKDDLFGPDGYDEVYVITNKDFLLARKTGSGGTNLTGIPFVDEGEGIKKLRESSPEYYAVFKKIVSQQGQMAKMMPFLFKEATIPIKIAGVDGEHTHKVGVVFMTDSPMSGMDMLRGYGRGLSGRADQILFEREQADFDDYKKFVVFTHEVGHLVDLNKRDSFQLDTSISDGSLQMGDHIKNFFSNLNHGEVLADEYAKEKFEAATKRGMTNNPFVMSTALNYRTLNNVEAGLFVPGRVTQHATTPFMSDGPFHGQSQDSYRQALLNITNGTDVSMAKLMGDYVADGPKQPVTFWEASIHGCFQQAVDMSARLRSESVAERIRKDGPAAGGIHSVSDVFRTCMIGDFSNRYKILTEQFIDTDPNSPEGKLLDMYLTAAENELPSTEFSRADGPGEQRQQKPAPMGVKP